MIDEKQLLLNDIKEKVDSSSGFIMTSYEGLNAASARKLRDHIAEAEGEFEVVPKRVFLKALEKSGVDANHIKLKGHIGIIFTKTEAVQLAKAAVQFSESNNNMLTFIGGFIDREICDGQEVMQLAKLPSLNELRAQFVGLLTAPMAQTVGTLHAALASMLYCFDAKCSKG